jgi:hypothetical protein
VRATQKQDLKNFKKKVEIASEKLLQKIMGAAKKVLEREMAGLVDQFDEMAAKMKKFHEK